MECKLCHEDKNHWTEMLPVRVRTEDHINDQVDVCIECICKCKTFDRLRAKLIRRGF